MSKGSSQGLSWMLMLARLGFVGYGWSVSVNAAGPLLTQTASVGSGQARAGHTLLIAGPQGAGKAQEAPWPPQTPACAKWLQQPSQYLCPQCWTQVCWEWVWGNVPKTVLPATLMEISVPNQLSWMKDLGHRSLEFCQLGADPAFREQWWETACAGFFQVIALSIQNHLGRRYLFILQREVPDFCSLGAWSVFFRFGIFLFFLF